jgi:hypothetical protein
VAISCTAAALGRANRRRLMPSRRRARTTSAPAAQTMAKAGVALEHPLERVGQLERAAGRRLRAQHAVDLGDQRLAARAEQIEELGAAPRAVAQQAHEQVLGTNGAVSAPAGLLGRQHDDPPRTLGESIDHGRPPP